MNSTDVYFIPVSHIQIPLSGWYLLTYCTLCTSEYQVSGLRQLLMGSIYPPWKWPQNVERGIIWHWSITRVYGAKIFPPWWWLVVELNLSVGRANEIQEITQGTNVQQGLWLHMSNLGYGKGGMSKCLQEKHKIRRISKTFF